MTTLAELKARYRQQVDDLPVGTSGGTEAPSRAAFTCEELEISLRLAERSEQMPELAELEVKRDRLVARLNKGWEIVNPGGSGEQDPRLHDHFATVLHEYEAVCDQISSMAAGDSGYGSP